MKEIFRGKVSEKIKKIIPELDQDQKKLLTSMIDGFAYGFAATALIFAASSRFGTAAFTAGVSVANKTISNYMRHRWN